MSDFETPIAARAPSDGNTGSSGRLPVFEKIGFGLGDMASNLLFSTFNMFLLFFYTDVVGISAVAASWIFLGTRVFDMVNDPVMGAIADRTRTRMGSYRPYLLVFAVPFGLASYLLFMVPDLSYTGKLIYATGTYLFATVAYTAINIPYCALMGVITPDVRERTSVAQYRFFLAFSGGLLISFFTLPLVKMLGNKPESPTFNPEIGYDPVAGYPAAMLLFGALAVLLFMTTFFSTKERVLPVAKAKAPFAADLKDLMGNLPWLVLFISAILNLTSVSVRNGTTMYYMSYFVEGGLDDLFTIPLGAFSLDINVATMFMSLGALATMIGVLPAKWLTTRYEKKLLLLGLYGIQGVLYLLIYFVPNDGMKTLFALHLLASFFGGPTAVLTFAMYADVADFSEWKTGRRATGLIVATILFAIKAGLVLGGWLNGMLLGMFGYTKQTASNPEVVDGIRLIFTVAPALFVIGAGAIMVLYTISSKRLHQIETVLSARRAKG